MDFDIFISYSTNDNSEAMDFWIDKFVEAIESQTQLQFGQSLRIWRDTNNILPGANLNGIINQGIYESKILIPILSPSYVTSSWCADELETFHSYHQATLEMDNTMRIFPVVLMPYEEVPYRDSGAENLQRIKKIVDRQHIRMEKFFEVVENVPNPIPVSSIQNHPNLLKMAKSSGDMAIKIVQNAENVVKRDQEKKENKKNIIFILCPPVESDYWKKEIGRSLIAQKLSHYEVSTDLSDFPKSRIDIFMINPGSAEIETFNDLYDQATTKPYPFIVVVSKRLSLENELQSYLDARKSDEDKLEYVHLIEETFDPAIATLILEKVKTHENQVQERIMELEADVKSVNRNVFVLYDLQSQDRARASMKRVIHTLYKEEEFVVAVQSSLPENPSQLQKKRALEAEDNYLLTCHGVVVFYGEYDGSWFDLKVSKILHAKGNSKNLKIWSIYIDEPEKEQKESEAVTFRVDPIIAGKEDEIRKLQAFAKQVRS